MLVVSLTAFIIISRIPEPNVSQWMAIGVMGPEVASPTATAPELLPSLIQPFTSPGRQPFRPITEKKKMPPVVLALPVWQMNVTVFLPPRPGPAAMYWHQLPKERGTPLSADQINHIPILTRLSNIAIPLESKLSALATDFNAQIRPQDMVSLKDGKSYSGKLVSITNKQVVLFANEGKRSYPFPRDRVAKIQRKMLFDDVLQAYWKRMGNDAPSAVRLLEAAQELNNTEWAEAYYQKLLEQFPDAYEVYLSYGRYWEQKCAWEQALQVYQHATQRNIANESLKLAEADLLSRMNLSSQALATLAKASRPMSWLKAVEIAVQSQNWTAANQFLQKFQGSYDPNTQDQIWYWQARIALQQGDIEGCSALCQKIRTSTPALVNLQAVVLYCQGQFAQAVPLLEKAIADGELDAVYNLALVYAAGGALAPAQELLAKLAELPHWKADASSIKAILGYWQYPTSPEKYEETAKLFQAAATINSQNPLVWGLWAETAYNAQQYAVVIGHCQKALELDFYWALPLVRLAATQLQQNQSKEARQYLLEAHARSWIPAYMADIEAGLAQTYLMEQEQTTAYQYLLAATKHVNSHSHANKLLAWQVNLQGNPNQALAYLDLVITQNSEDEYAQTAQKLIDENQKIMLWEDSFSRDDGPVRRRWQESAQDGIEIAIRQQKVLFHGTNFKGGITSLLRWTETAHFYTFRMQVEARTCDKSWVGIFYGNWDEGGIVFGKTSDQRIAYAIGKPGRWDSWQFLSAPGYERWPEQPVRLSIAQSREQRNLLSLMMGDQVLAQVQFRGSPSKIQVGAFGFANAGESWQANFDNAQILEMEK